MLKKISFMILVSIVTFPVISFLLGFSVFSINWNYADLFPKIIINIYYIIWFFCIIFSFILPIISLLKKKPLICSSSKFYIMALISSLIFASSFYIYLWYLSIESGGFHAA